MKHTSVNRYLRANGTTTMQAPTMKSLAGSSRSVAIIATALVFSAVPNLRADLTKANNTNALNLATSWTHGTNTPTSSDVLIWNNTVTGTNSVLTGAAISALGLKIVNPGGAVTITSTATNTLTLGASGIDMSSATQNLTLAGAGPILGAAQEWNVAASRTLTVSGPSMNMGGNVLTLAGDGNFTLSSTISSSSGASITKNGSGTLLFSANNSKNVGNIALNGGTYEQSHQNANSGNTITAANGTKLYLNNISFSNAGLNISSAATVTLQGTGGGTRRWGNYTFNDGSSTNFETNGGTGTATFISNGNITLNGNVILNATTADVDFSIGSRSLIGGTSLTKTGNGKLTLGTGASATYTGGTFVNGGTVVLARSGGTLADAGAVTVDGGTLTLNQSDTVAAVTLKNGTIDGVGTLTGSSYAVESGSVSAILAGTNISLNKSTAGTVTLSGINTYTGATTVGAGTLAINGNQAAATGAVGVSGNGTRLIGNNGTIGGNTTINSGAIHSPGGAIANTDKVGKQTFDQLGIPTTNLTYGASSIFEWDLNSKTDSGSGTPGVGYDGVDVTGTLAVNSTAIFRVVLGTGATTGDLSFWQQDRTWNNIFAGGFTLLNGEGFTSSLLQVVDTSGNNFTQNSLNPGYAFTVSGTSLTWSAVPEPTSALAGLLIGAGLLRRRRA